MPFEHEIESVFQGSYYKDESAYGTSTGDAKQFYTMTVSPTLEVPGATLPVGMTQGLATSSWTASGQLCWEELPFLSGIKPTVTSGSISGGVVSNTTSEPNSFTLIHRTLQATGCVVSGFKINGDTENIETEVNFIGKGITNDGSVSGVSPLAPTLYVPYQTTVTIGSAQSKVNSWSLDVSDIWSNVNYLSTSNTPLQTVAQKRCSGKFSAVLPYDKAMALGILSDNGVKSVSISNTTTVGSYEYTFTISFKIMFDNAEGPSDTNEVWTLPVNGIIMNDGSNQAITITATKTAATQQGGGE